MLLLCSAGVVIVGLASVLYLLGLLAWQLDTRLETGSWVALPSALVFADRALLQGGDVAPVLAFIPHFTYFFTQLNWTWHTNEVIAQILSELHIGALPGLIGCAILAAGISGVLRQRLLIRIHKQRRKDPVRPAESFPAEPSRPDAGYDGRREPVIGATDLAPSPANDTPAPQPAAQTAAAAPARSVARPCKQARGRPTRRRAA
jgi:hypothetical protein